MKQLILIIFILASIGCNTEKRGAMRLASLKTTHPKLVASFCGENYPVKESTTHTIEYREGKHDTIWQNEYIDCDTVIGQNQVVRVPYPVQIKSKDTVVIKSIEIKENTAKIEALNLEVSDYKAELKRQEKRTEKAAYGGFLIGVILCGGVCIFAFSKIK